MEAMVTSHEDGRTHTRIGLTICEGPGRFRMILTRPYHDVGRIVEIPRQEIDSIESVAPGNLGDTPAPITSSRAG